MSIEQAVGILIGVIATGVLKWLADRYPTAAQRRRRELEDRLLEAQIEQIENDDKERP